jgi:hypothetical protein
MALGLMTQIQINTGPGTFGGQTDTAVREFQSKNGLQQTGVVNSVNLNILFNSGIVGSPVEPVPGNSGGIDPTEELDPGVFRARAGKNYFVRDDILMTSPLQAKIEKVADAYFKITGKKITITSGYRGAFRQARAMHKKLMERGGEAKVIALYKNKALLKEILAAFHKNRSNSTVEIKAMQVVIANQLKRPAYISNHLRGNSADVALTADADILERAIVGVGRRVVREDDHRHIEFNP